MFKIRDQLLDAMTKMGVVTTELGGDEYNKLVQEVRRKYTKKGIGSGWIWDDLHKAVSIHDDNAWMWIEDFSDGHPAILFFDESSESGRDRAAFEFSTTAEMVLVLGESYGFEFYVTNRAIDYLLCYNHHNVLVASGSTQDWLTQKIEEMDGLD